MAPTGHWCRSIGSQRKAEWRWALTWQEGGVDEALGRGYLKTLILAVYTNPAQPDNLIEAWSFNFQYNTAPDGSLEASFSVRDHCGGLVAGDLGSGLASLDQLKRQAHKIIKE
jgi:hypothetical protein